MHPSKLDMSRTHDQILPMKAAMTRKAHVQRSREKRKEIVLEALRTGTGGQTSRRVLTMVAVAGTEDAGG